MFRKQTFFHVASTSAELVEALWDGNGGWSIRYGRSVQDRQGWTNSDRCTCYNWCCGAGFHRARLEYTWEHRAV